MKLLDPKSVEKIKEAMGLVETLKIPQHLQPAAFEYLLLSGEIVVGDQVKASAQIKAPALLAHLSANNLRDYVASLNLKAAVMEIPALLYWAKTNESLEIADEKIIIELYRRAGMRPPKNITQSLRDLASKKYGRVESVAGQSGFVKLSRVGEDFVIHDVIEKSHRKVS